LGSDLYCLNADSRSIIIACYHRWALNPISVMSNIGLSLYWTVRYRTDRIKICRIFQYRTKVFSDIRYPTSKFLKSCCMRSLNKQTELSLGCFKSSPALTSQNSSRATLVKLVQTLKGQCHDIFDPQFFSSNNLILALD
jgi:hypothetical protein